MILHRSEDMPAAAGGAAEPAAARLPVRRVTAMMLLAAAVLDLTRCGIVMGTVTQAGTAAGLVSAGLAAATASVWTARGCQRGARWSGWAAFLIGTGSGPQAAASGFHGMYAIPGTATAALGVLVAAGVLATAGRTSQPAPPENRLPFLLLLERLITTKRVSRQPRPSIRPASRPNPPGIPPLERISQHAQDTKSDGRPGHRRRGGRRRRSGAAASRGAPAGPGRMG